MLQDEIKALFDQQAAGYDVQWAKTAPIKNGLHYLLESMFAGLPANARVLCVGVGTGAEMVHLAMKNPGWQFTAVEPSGPMLAVCRARAEEAGFASRCLFHEGYLETLPADAGGYDAATCFLVSQFLLDPEERAAFFRGIAQRLKPGGLLASADLAAEVESPEYEVLLGAWMRMMSAADITPEGLARMRHAYAHDVGVLPPDRVAEILKAGGFQQPVLFFQAGLIHAWVSGRG